MGMERPANRHGQKIAAEEDKNARFVEEDLHQGPQFARHAARGGADSHGPRACAPTAICPVRAVSRLPQRLSGEGHKFMLSKYYRRVNR